MIHRNGDKTLVFDQNGCTGFKICSRHGRDFLELRLSPGCGIPPHVQDFYIDFIMISGSGIVCVDDAEYPVAAGDVVHAEPRQRRGLRNDGEQELLVYAIRQHRERSVTSGQ
jgi:uncharacterized cupin superfamily protein